MKKLLNILLFIIIIVLAIYSFSAIYDFPQPKPFSGSRFYNPYEGIDSNQWKKANFHVHSKVLFGLMDGRANTPEMIFNTYKTLGYNIISVSNYQSINVYKSADFNYIPAYEHGYGIQKTHQLSLGAKSVFWLDFPFFQSLSNKQFIIDRLKQKADFVSLNHPSWRNAFTASDMKYLSGYDCFEVLNHNKSSVALWDTALSYGHKAFILADDDAHNVTKTHQVGRCCTFINTSSLQLKDIIAALKSGKAFGAEIAMSENESLEDKAKDIAVLPFLRSVTVSGNTLNVSVSSHAASISFIGQNGKLLAKVADAMKASYEIKQSDSYVRSEILFPSGTKYYLNPVFRYDDNMSNSSSPTVNVLKTMLYRSVIIIIILLLLSVVFIKSVKRVLKKS